MNTLTLFLRRLLALCTLLFISTALRADPVSISFTASLLYDASGDLLPTGNLVLLIADTADNGFGPFEAGSTLNIGDFLNGDDQILGSTTIQSGDYSGGAFGSATGINLSSAPFATLTSGDPLALVWFSTVTGESTALAAGDSYGLFSTTSPTDDSAPWAVPSAGNTIDLYFLTEDSSGTHPETDAYATQTVAAIPEPATTAALAALCALGLIAWHRRRA